MAKTGDGTLTYQWQTNGVNIANNSHYAGCTTSTLWVTNAQSADAVNYRCVATAGCGSANSSDATLTIKAGQKVRWKWTGGNHDVKSGSKELALDKTPYNSW